MVDLDTIANLPDYAFMKIYRSPYWHVKGLKATMDQEALGFGPGPRGTRRYRAVEAPTGEAERIKAERVRRGLSYPQSWIEAGLMDPDPAGPDF